MLGFLHDIFNTIRLFGTFEHLRKKTAKDKNILRFSEDQTPEDRK